MSSTAACGRLRIDVVEIEADARLEAGDRILLADSADEGGQRGVGAARRLERDVRGGVGKVGDVDRAGALERLALIGGDGDRHVLQVLRAAPGGDDDVGILVGTGGRRSSSASLAAAAASSSVARRRSSWA